MRVRVVIWCLGLCSVGCKEDRTIGAEGEAESEAEGEGEGDDPTAVLFHPDHIVEVAIEMDAADWETLRLQTRDILETLAGDCTAQPFESPFTYFPAQVTVDGTVMQSVGVRKKGFLGSLSETKPALRVKFDEYLPEQKYLELSGLVLNNSRQDPSYVHQCLTYGVFAEAGLPASRCNFAHVVVNDQDLGVFVNVEHVGKDLLRRYFDDEDGNLYEATLSDFTPELVNTFEKKTNEDDPDRSDLDVLVQALETPSGGLLDALDEVFMMDQFYRFWAVEGLVFHWDGYESNRNNYFVYFDPADQRAWFLPWGVDGAMATVDPFAESGAPTSVGIQGYLGRRLWLDVGQSSRYVTEMQDLLDNVWDETTLLSEIDRMEKLFTPIALAVGEDPAAAVDDVRVFVEGRRQVVLEELTPTPPSLSDAVIRGVPCLNVLGEITATFTTTFGTLDDDDPFGSGTGTLTGTLDGETIQTTLVGSVAGFDENTPTDPPVLIEPVATLDDGRVAVPVVSIPAASFYSGAALDIGGTAFGVLFMYDPDTFAFTLEGLMFGGYVEITQAGTVDGDPVEGTFTATLIQFLEP